MINFLKKEMALDNLVNHSPSSDRGKKNVAIDTLEKGSNQTLTKKGHDGIVLDKKF